MFNDNYFHADYFHGDYFHKGSGVAAAPDDDITTFFQLRATPTNVRLIEQPQTIQVRGNDALRPRLREAP